MGGNVQRAANFVNTNIFTVYSFKRDLGVIFKKKKKNDAGNKSQQVFNTGAGRRINIY